MTVNGYVKGKKGVQAKSNFEREKEEEIVPRVFVHVASPLDLFDSFSPFSSLLLSLLFVDSVSCLGSGLDSDFGSATTLLTTRPMRCEPTFPAPSIGPSFASKSLASRSRLWSWLVCGVDWVQISLTYRALPPGVLTEASLITLPTCSL